MPLLALAVFLLAGLVSTHAGATEEIELTSVIVEWQGDAPIVRLTTSQPPKYTATALASPPRIVIDVESARHAWRGPLSANPEWREKMVALEMEIDAVEMNELMFYSSLKTGDAPGNMGSVVKMRGTEVGQKVTELAVEAVGWYGAPFTELRNYDSNIVSVGGDYVDDVSPRHFNTRKTTIYGGSSEVQRNLLAKAMLGL